MRGGFWKRIIWGSILATVLSVILGPLTKPQKKPLTERSAEAIIDTTHGLMRKARHARKRIMKKID